MHSASCGHVLRWLERWYWTQITGHIKPVGIGDMHRFIGVVSFSAEKGCWPILACIGDTYHLLVMCVESGICLCSAIIS